MQGGGLLERASELAAIGTLIERAKRREGGVLLVEGIAGIGKTALLEAARRKGQEAGLSVLVASGGELEREFPYGIVRQLFEPCLRGLAGDERDVVLSGAAALAAPIVTSAVDRSSQGGDSFPALHGLYWLTANLADRQPRLLVVDDAHWGDAASQRFLVFLARRLEGLAAAMVVAARPDEPDTDRGVFAELASLPSVDVVRPAGLTAAAVGQLVAAELGAADPDFVDACHEATGGTPFLVRELIAALAADGVRPTNAAARRVRDLGPTTVAHATLLRLSRLPAATVPVAHAVAVLGADARLPLVAALCGLGEAAVSDAADALAAARVLRSRRPLEFVHPIVRTAVYDQMPIGTRSLAHERAAEMLVAEGAGVDSVAAHLLLVEPAARPAVVEWLRAAARGALERGAADAAIAYLRRALDEAPDRGVRFEVLHELGLAERVLRKPEAIDHLEEALALADDPARRAEVSLSLAYTVMFVGRLERVVTLLESAIEGLGEQDEALALHLSGPLVGIATNDPRFEKQIGARADELVASADHSPARRALLLALAGRLAARGERTDEVPGLVEAGLDEGRFLAEETSESNMVPQGIAALVYVDHLDAAEEVADALAADARARGSVTGFAAGAVHRALVATRRGNLVDAEADMRAAFEVILEHGLLFGVPIALWYCADAMIERPSLDDLAAIVETVAIPPDLLRAATGAWLLETRGRLRALHRDHAGAVADLRACGAALDELGQVNPSYSGWRSALAVELAADDRDDAIRLAHENVGHARRTGIARGLGVALRAQGAIEGSADTLREAAALLERSPARLEEARALVDLGAVLRRRGRRTEARDALRDGLDLARRCGADRLADRARDELGASGARLRREAASGVESLTPGERRVALLAAQSLSNAEIAQALFVTVNTVQTHLSHVYAKLDISSRAQLAAALAEIITGSQ